MINSYKKDILMNIVDTEGIVFGAAPASRQLVSFAYTTNIATAINDTVGGRLVFVNDRNGNAAIFSGGTRLSSAIQKVEVAAASGAKHGGKTITVTYINDTTKDVSTATFDVIDEAGLEAYFTGSTTISLTDNTYEVIVDNATILVDELGGLKTGLKIKYVQESGTSSAKISLQDNSDTELSSVNVSDILGDGVLHYSNYNPDDNVLTLRFGNGKAYNPGDPTTYTEAKIDLKELFDISDVGIKLDSSIYLNTAIDASTLKIGAIIADPSTATADATGLTDAYQVKQYVDSKTVNLSVSGNGDNYVNLRQDPANNKLLNASINIDTTFAAEQTGNTGATLTGSANKLVDANKLATEVTKFVDWRINSSINALDATVTNETNDYVDVSITETDGILTSVTVTPKKSTITHTTNSSTELSATTGILDGAEAMTAVKNYVDANINYVSDIINSLDANLTEGTETSDVSISLTQVDGKVTAISVTSDIATVSAGADNLALAATGTGFIKAPAVAEIKKYVDAVVDASIKALDATKNSIIATNDASILVVETDGKISDVSLVITPATVTYTPANETDPASFINSQDGFVKGSDIATFKQYVDDKIAEVNSAVKNLDASVNAWDSSNFTTAGIGQVDGLITTVNVQNTYATFTSSPGTLAVAQNGIVKGDTIVTAINNALSWTIL